MLSIYDTEVSNQFIQHIQSIETPDAASQNLVVLQNKHSFCPRFVDSNKKAASLKVEKDNTSTSRKPAAGSYHSHSVA